MVVLEYMKVKPYMLGAGCSWTKAGRYCNEIQSSKTFSLIIPKYLGISEDIHFLTSSLLRNLSHSYLLAGECDLAVSFFFIYQKPVYGLDGEALFVDTRGKPS